MPDDQIPQDPQPPDAPPAVADAEPPLAIAPPEPEPAVNPPMPDPAPLVLSTGPITAVPAVGFVPEPVAVTYTRRSRIKAITARNPYNGQPSTLYEREIVVEGSDESVRFEDLPPLVIPFHPARRIYARNLETLQPTGDIHRQGEAGYLLHCSAIDEQLRDIGDPSMADKPAFDPAP